MPPTGGPLDDSPPSILRTSPALYATEVSVDAPLRLVFSESMNKSRVLDEIVVRPHVDWGRSTWRGDTLEIRAREGWSGETTYTVLLRRAMTDRRDNALAEPGLIVFATGAHVARGTVSGRLERIGVSQGRVLVLAFAASTADTTTIDPLAAVSAGEADANGAFLVPGLEVGRGYEIGAWFDIDEDRDFDPGKDLYVRALNEVVPDSAGGPTDVELVLVFADEPGGITGVVADSTCEALSELTRRLAARADSALTARDSLVALRASLQAEADSLFGVLVAPEDQPAAGADTLRIYAESLRRRAASLAIPDSGAILALRRLPARARTDSVYCGRPVIARFFAAEGDSAPVEERLRGTDGPFRISTLAPGAYHGAVWRDVMGDGTFGSREPGRSGIRVWVPPGRNGVVDTLRIGAPDTLRLERPDG